MRGVKRAADVAGSRPWTTPEMPPRLRDGLSETHEGPREQAGRCRTQGTSPGVGLAETGRLPKMGRSTVFIDVPDPAIVSTKKKPGRPNPLDFLNRS